MTDTLKVLNPQETGYYGLGEDIHISRQVRFRAKPDNSEKSLLLGIPKEKPEQIVAMVLKIAKEIYTKDSIGEAIVYLNDLMEKTYTERGENPKDLVVDTNEMLKHYKIKSNVNYMSVGEIHIGTRPWGTLRMTSDSTVGIKSGKGSPDMFILYTLWFAVHVYKRDQILELVDQI